MKKNRLIAFVLSLCLICAFSIPAMAAGNDAPDSKCAYVETTDTSIDANPYSATGSFSGPLSGEYVNYDMVLHGSYRYWKMLITNNGDYDIQVDVNGKIFTVKAHTSGYIYSTNKWWAGTYKIGFSTKSPTHSMNGSVSCTLYTTLAESQP